jgi:hypothetical protein
MESKTNALARKIVSETVSQMTDQERAEVLDWANRSLVVVENKELTRTQKLIELRKVHPSKAALRIIAALARLTKSKVWDNQSWARRLGIAGLATGAAVFGSKAAGVAALGSAIGVPLALITGAGATVLGVIIDEVKK